MGQIQDIQPMAMAQRLQVLKTQSYILLRIKTEIIIRITDN